MRDFKVEEFGTDGPIFLTAKRNIDRRGFFTELYKDSLRSKFGIPPFVQENITKSHKDVIRGLHWQLAPYSQGKLISCIAGEMTDYFLDLRRSSRTFGNVFSQKLSDESSHWLWVPAGFAHGFESHLNGTVVIYKSTNQWSKEHERGIDPLDPQLGIDFSTNSPILSDRDKSAPKFSEILESEFFV